MAQHVTRALPYLKRALSAFGSWLLLGFFADLMFSLADNARTNTPGSYDYPFALAVSLAAGILVACLEAFWIACPAYSGRRLALRLLYVFLWLLFPLFAYQVHRRAAPHYNVVTNTPLRVDTAHTVQATFTAVKTGTHYVQLELKRAVPFEKLEAFVGGTSEREKPPPPDLPRPQIVWTVHNASKASVASYWQGEFWGRDTVGVSLGEFKTVEGQTYTLTAEVTHPSPQAQVLDPHLQVIWYNDLYALPLHVAFGGFLALVVGFGLAARLAWKMRTDSAFREGEGRDEEEFPALKTDLP